MIAILLITFSSCSKLRRTETETEVEATFKSLVTAQVSTEGGSYDKGYKLPSILITQGSGKAVNQGAAMFKPVEMMQFKDEYQNGLIFNFYNNVDPKSLMAQVATKIAGNKFYIPWRYISPHFVYVNPYFDNKHIKGDLVTDAGVHFHIRINFPYSLVSYYINDKQGNTIRFYVNDLASRAQARIRNNKARIKIHYPGYRNAQKDIATIKNQAAKIDSKIASMKAEIDVVNKNRDQNIKDLIALNIQYNKEYVAYKNTNNQVGKIGHGIAEQNASVKAMSDSIKTLEASKADPAIQKAAAQKSVDEAAKQAEVHFNTLLWYAPTKSAPINASKSFWLQQNTPQYKMKLEQFVPKL